MASQPPIPADYLLAVALFDTNGFPKEHFATQIGLETANFQLTPWVQGIFQSLGLQSLLSTSLQLEGARFFVARASNGSLTVGIRRHSGYLAALFAPEIGLQAQDLVPWLHDFDATEARPNHRRVIPLHPDA